MLQRYQKVNIFTDESGLIGDHEFVMAAVELLDIRLELEYNHLSPLTTV